MMLKEPQQLAATEVSQVVSVKSPASASICALGLPPKEPRVVRIKMGALVAPSTWRSTVFFPFATTLLGVAVMMRVVVPDDPPLLELQAASAAAASAAMRTKRRFMVESSQGSPGWGDLASIRAAARP